MTKIRPNVPFTVGGLTFMETSGRWPYVVLKDYSHSWRNRPRCRNNLNPATINDNNGKPVATLTPNAVTLHKGYRWDGSTGVMDFLECSRASALHDVWCQAMDRKIYKETFNNWERGAKEYYDVCIADNMPTPSALRRYSGIAAWGAIKHGIRRAGRTITEARDWVVDKGKKLLNNGRKIVRRVGRRIRSWF